MSGNIKETLEQRRLAANGATFQLLRDELLEAYKQDERNFSLANLYGANLRGANLDGANLRGANLYGANLHRANLYGANLDGANLDGANLYGANLDGANLRGANLHRANLYGANLDGANLDGANLHRANLYGANLDGANFIASISGVGDLRRTIWAYRRKEDKVIIVRAGCREESAKDVIKAIQTDYGKDSANGKAYIKAVKLLVELVELQYVEYERE